MSEDKRFIRKLLSQLRDGLLFVGIAFVGLACGILAKDKYPDLDGNAVLWLGACALLAGFLISIGLVTKKGVKA